MKKEETYEVILPYICYKEYFEKHAEMKKHGNESNMKSIQKNILSGPAYFIFVSDKFSE